MKLRFGVNKAAYWASRYSYPKSDDPLNGPLRQAVREQGFFTLDQVLEVCRWKSPRTVPKIEKNDPAFVKTVTGIAVSTTDERLRVEVLTLLDGVGWPVASVLLHYGVSDDYPILDVRALWSLSKDVKSYEYKFALWDSYLRTCRALSAEAGVSIRELDKALWQYSKEKQSKRRG